MLQRSSPSVGQAANDNFAHARHRATASHLRLPAAVVPTGNARRGLWPPLVLGFAGLALVVLCAALLLGLAAVGLLAMAVCGIELVRRQVWRPARPALGPFDRRVIGV